jgi:hypothetical protein
VSTGMESERINDGGKQVTYRGTLVRPSPGDLVETRLAHRGPGLVQRAGGGESVGVYWPDFGLLVVNVSELALLVRHDDVRALVGRHDVLTGRERDTWSRRAGWLIGMTVVSVCLSVVVLLGLTAVVWAFRQLQGVMP